MFLKCHKAKYIFQKISMNRRESPLKSDRCFFLSSQLVSLSSRNSFYFQLWFFTLAFSRTLILSPFPAIPTVQCRSYHTYQCFWKPMMLLFSNGFLLLLTTTTPSPWSFHNFVLFWPWGRHPSPQVPSNPLKFIFQGVEVGFLRIPSNPVKTLKPPSNPLDYLRARN